MTVRRFCGTIAVTFVAVLGCWTDVHAQSLATWTVESVRGTLLGYENERWVEIAPGDTLGPAVPLRTLGSAAAVIGAPAIRITLGGDTLIQFIGRPRTGARLQQYSGTVVVETSGAGIRVELRTPTVEISADGEILRVEVSPAGLTTYDLAGGAARITEVATGLITQIDDGGAVSATADATVIPQPEATPASGSAHATAGQGGNSAGGNGKANSQGSAGGNGNAKAPPDRGQPPGSSGGGGEQGNGNGNGLGPGNSNAGGSGKEKSKGNAPQGMVDEPGTS